MSERAVSFWADRNRTFGLVMAGGLGGVALLRFVLSGSVTWWLIVSAAVCLVAGLLAPAWLEPVRAAWMKLAAGLGHVNSRILLTVLFIVLIVPTALVLKLLGRQPIGLRFCDGAASYWRRRTVGEFSARRMERQF
ncbi:MAG: SxtJ family membrane protein [Nitrospirota bacterium]